MAHAYGHNRQDTQARPRALAMPKQDHWTARETVVFTAAASGLLWLLLLRAPALF